MASRKSGRGGNSAAVKIVIAACIILALAVGIYYFATGGGSGDDISSPSPEVTLPQATQGVETTNVPESAAPTAEPDPDPAPSGSGEADESVPPAMGQSGSETAAGVGANLSVTVPESDAVGDDYFADAVFVGDSRTEGLKMYSGLPVSNFFSGVGLAVDKVFTERIVNMNGQYLTVAEALQQADYSKVYIMLGLNELGWVYESVFADEYGRIIDVIKQSHPDATIYVQSIIPVSQWKDGSSDIYTNANVVRLQKALCEMCEEKGVNYVNVAEAMQDANGYLPSDATPDGVHLTPDYCKIWMDYLKTHTA